MLQLHSYGLSPMKILIQLDKQDLKTGLAGGLSLADAAELRRKRPTLHDIHNVIKTVQHRTRLHPSDAGGRGRLDQ